MEKKENEIVLEVILVAGVINSTGKMLYWKTDIPVYIGDYAIVENMNGYDLIKVVGLVRTKETMASKFSNTKYENMKKVVDAISEGIIKQ